MQGCVFHYIESLLKFFFFRLFYAGAVEGQMPEILSMIQVNKMTPAPAVLVVVSVGFFLLTAATITSFTVEFMRKNFTMRAIIFRHFYR